MTQKYKGANHNGIDLVGDGYTIDDIVAHSEGTVVGIVSNINYNTYKTGQKIYGNYVKIEHSNGYYTFYAHLKYGSIKVKNGQKISKGEVIGTMGNTGYSTGAHLHFEVRNEKNQAIDPTNYLDKDIVKSNYIIGKTYVLQVNLKVRDGAGTNNKQKDYKELTADGKKNAQKGEKAVLNSGIINL